LNATTILLIFVGLRVAQHIAERVLAAVNRVYYLSPERQAEARRILNISEADMAKTLAYSEDKYAFSQVASRVHLLALLIFIAFGGLGLAEVAGQLFSNRYGGGPLVTGLVFFGVLGLASMLLNLPFDFYRTFVIEQRHGFNRQTPKGFFVDRLKGILIGILLGGPILAAILWIMGATGEYWWVYAWVAMSAFSIFAAWLYPTFLAPLFNKFSPVGDGELKTRIESLAAKIGFKAAGIFIMDASKRSSHGNAYFTGVFGKKRIVLFDTLVQNMGAAEVVAVLAHELGHFKLHHVRWQLIRGTLMTGLTFFLLSLCLPLAPFYQAFGLSGISNYGALVVFGLWFGIVDFLLQPIENHLSRRNEFAADDFAKAQVGNADELASALLKLREQSHAMPITHPVFSSVYHSHPPLLERLAAIGYGAR
jgi:STE24 endopeptidase